MIDSGASEVEFIECRGEGFVPQVAALMQSIDTLFYTSHFPFLIMTRGQAHVDSGVNGTVEVHRFDVHLMQFPILGSSKGNDSADRGEACDRSEGVLEVDTIHLGKALGNEVSMVLDYLPI